MDRGAGEREARVTDARWLTRKEAAHHVTFSETSFTRRVKKGIFPAPSTSSGALRWDVLARDAVMAGGTIPASREDAIDAIAEEIRARAKGRPQANGGRNNPRIPIRARAG